MDSGTLEIRNIILALLQTGSDELANEIAFDYYSDVVVETLLAWSAEREADVVLAMGKKWKGVLAQQTEQCIRWLKRNQPAPSSTVLLLSTVLDPFSREIDRGGTKIWFSSIKPVRGKSHTDSLVSAMTFFLALGFRNIDTTSANLVVKSFEPVYLAAEQDQISERDWSRLKTLAPKVTWDREWDKCERLRGALLEHFVRCKWSYQAFLNCLKNPKLLEEVTNQALEHDGWFYKKSDFIKRAAELAAQGRLKSTREQKKVLSNSFNINLSSAYVPD